MSKMPHWVSVRGMVLKGNMTLCELLNKSQRLSGNGIEERDDETVMYAFVLYHLVRLFRCTLVWKSVPVSHCFVVVMGRFAFRKRPMFSLCFVSEGHVTSAFHEFFWERAYARGVEVNPSAWAWYFMQTLLPTQKRLIVFAYFLLVNLST